MSSLIVLLPSGYTEVKDNFSLQAASHPMINKLNFEHSKKKIRMNINPKPPNQGGFSMNYFYYTLHQRSTDDYELINTYNSLCLHKNRGVTFISPDASPRSQPLSHKQPCFPCFELLLITWGSLTNSMGHLKVIFFNLS